MRWHRRVSPWAVGLITVHVVAITLGYAEAASSDLLHEVWLLLVSYRDMLAAAVGFDVVAGAPCSLSALPRPPYVRVAGNRRDTC